MSFQLSSNAFHHGDSLPLRCTCDGEGVSPEVHWSNIPDGTKSLVLFLVDPDAPDPSAPKRTWVHWVLYDLPPALPGLPEGIRGADLPAEAMEGLNDWQRPGYGAPCPPIGRHRYLLKLFALDTQLGELRRPGKPRVEQAMKGHVLGSAELMGTYERI